MSKNEEQKAQPIDEVAELKRQLAEKDAALAKAEEEKTGLAEELEQQRIAREELEAENRRLDEHAAQFEKSELRRLQNEEKVTINIAEGEGGEGKDDVFVSVQAVPYQIKRGVDVAVPRSVYKVLRDSAYNAHEIMNTGDGVEYSTRMVPRFNIRVLD
ncbi:hypothetical protein [Maridesulfovibrio sp. FT414]|uniref:hypothetical protein n=1 Tax=Maridesulfovibrio sp. FT414 TaxID=2979469 RepID=UPI003D80417C